MELIDWAGVARNALWIVGLAVALSAWSYGAWRSSREGRRLRQLVLRPSFQAPAALGMLLLAASMSWGAAHLWERLVWVAIGAAFAWQAISAWRAGERSGG